MSDIKASTYEGLVLLTPSDTTVFVKPYAGLYISGAGTLTISDARGVKTQITIGVVGFVLPVAVTQVWATGTSATGICALVAFPYPGGAA